MQRMNSRVAVVSGAARGQGRAHAVTLAREGASIVAFDVCDSFNFTMAPPASEADLAETKRLVEETGQRCLTAKVDARDLGALTALADQAVAEFGKVDALVVNHGVWSPASNSWELEEESWQESIDVLLTGAWKVVKAFAPKMIENGEGGGIVLTSSDNGTHAQPGAIAYCAAKGGVINMMQVLAWELGPHKIRVNAILPGVIDTPMAQSAEKLDADHWPRWFGTDRQLLQVGMQPPESMAHAALWLLSDEAKYVTGVKIPVDAGWAAF
ncbi:mycofactocin-coupled SDR family oxidoreductase [Rhodococcus fascians]|nr:mycofactocin-coupled SDR family oxidoreductase [Rhodococcus fascians]MBY4433106.1 mycofactocin-coupled SDR family oxidoreductase [Rhodococcus fascians]